MIQGVVSIHKLLAAMRKLEASDLHLKVGIAPTYRIGGLLKRIDADPLTEELADHLLDPIVPESLRERYDKTGNLDFATHLEDGDRFRINMFRSGGHTHAAIRRVKAEIPSYDELRLPPIYGKVIETTTEGMILIVGVLLAAFGFSPFDIIDSIRRLIREIYNLGWNTIEKAARYFLLGAVIVFPVWLVARVLKWVGGGRSGDLVDTRNRQV